jgi:hypothetical protein
MKWRTFILTCAFTSAIAGVAAAQTADKPKDPATTTALAAASTDISVSGKVVSSTSTELVINTDAGRPMTFQLDPKTHPAASFTVGERVTVQYHSLSGGTVYQAASIALDPQAKVAARYDDPAEPANTEPRDYEADTSTRSRLPATASVLPMIGLLGLLAVSGALVVRMARS